MLKRLLVTMILCGAFGSPAYAENSAEEYGMDTLSVKLGMSLMCMNGFVHAINSGSPVLVTQSLSIDGIGGVKEHVMGWDKARINAPIKCSGERIFLEQVRN